MITTPYMGLAAWNSVADEWQHEQLANNFRKLDEHDHSGGKGLQIPTGGIEDGAITTSKIAPSALSIGDNSVDTRHIKNGAITFAKLAEGAVRIPALADGSITSSKIAGRAVYSRHLGRATARSVGLHPRGRGMNQFTPGIAGNNSTPVASPSPAPRGGGGTNVKLKIPAGGGLLHVYAEGIVSSIPRSPANSSDWITVYGYANISSTTFARSGVIGSAIFSQVGTPTTGLWCSWPGATLKQSRNEIPPIHLSNNTSTAGAAGGPITYYIPAGAEDLTVSVSLSIQCGSGSSGLRTSYGQQTLAAWTSSLPLDTFDEIWGSENDTQYWARLGI